MPPPVTRLDRGLLIGKKPALLSAKDSRGQPITFDPQPVEEVPDWAKAIIESHNKNADALKDVVSNGIPVANQALQDYRSILVQMPSDAPFVFAENVGGDSLGAGFYDAAYLMEPGGHLTLRGSRLMYNDGDPIFTLPTGYRPAGDLAFICDSVDGVSFLRVSTAGVVSLLSSTGTTKYAFLECIRFVVPSAAAPHRFLNSGWPLVLNHGFNKPVTGLHVVGCRAKNVVGFEAAGAPYVDWEDLGDGSLKIHAVWGLQWGKVYDVRVLLSAED